MTFSKTPGIKLDLRELESGKHHFLTAAAGLNFGHAASVCIESQQHSIESDVIGDGHFKKIYSLYRYSVTEEMKRTWNDDEVTTEQGAYAVAFLLASTEMNVKAIEKSKKKTGIDYWLGTEDGFLFQKKIRLEVSGIRQGTEQQVQTRFESKIKQSTKSDGTGLPALVVIVEFGTPQVRTGLRNIL